MRVGFMRLAAASGVFLCGLAANLGGAAAQVTYVGDTTGAPVWNRPFTFTDLSGVGTATPFQTLNVRIDDGVSFSFEVISAPFDTFLHLYQGGFDSTQQF